VLWCVNAKDGDLGASSSGSVVPFLSVSAAVRTVHTMVLLNLCFPAASAKAVVDNRRTLPAFTAVSLAAVVSPLLI
jgi:hypothetical protein